MRRQDQEKTLNEFKAEMDKKGDVKKKLIFSFVKN